MTEPPARPKEASMQGGAARRLEDNSEERKEVGLRPSPASFQWGDCRSQQSLRLRSQVGPNGPPCRYATLAGVHGLRSLAS